MNLADSLQALDVRLVGVAVERIDEEDDGVDVPGRHSRRDLEVSTLDTGQDALNLQSRLLLEQPSRAVRRDDRPFAEG